MSAATWWPDAAVQTLQWYQRSELGPKYQKTGVKLSKEKQMKAGILIY
jgi:hypothetical protein